MTKNLNKGSINTIKQLPIGISDFKELIKENYHFIDKSSFIKDIINDGSKVIVITRPRRFGKTLNMSMLMYFLQQGEENLFANLLVSKDKEFCKKHQNQYPIIFISFKEVRQDSFAEAYSYITTLISNVYKTHRYLLDDNLLFDDEKNIFNKIINREAIESDIVNSLSQLSEYLERNFQKKPIILIDEYDTPIQTAYLKNYYEPMIGVMRGILGAGLKDNKLLGKAVITGITRVAQESLFSGVNNLEIYSLLREEYGQYFGFAEAEVEKLIKDIGQKISIKGIKEWYNGYQIGKHILYNPWSIINCLKNNGKLQPYWLGTSSNALIHELLNNSTPIIKQQFEYLLQNGVVEQPLLENLVFPDLKKKAGALWSLLLYAGYLNVLSTERRGHLLMAKISIPNKEVMYVYDEIVEQWFSDTISLESYISLTRSLSKGDIETFKRRLSEYLLQTASYFDFNANTPESVFHSFILGLVVGLKDDYIIGSNQEAGLGRVDVMFIPKDKNKNGIILEFKVSDSTGNLVSKAREALEQIKCKEYIQTLKQHKISYAFLIGLAFYGKQVEMVYEKEFIDLP